MRLVSDICGQRSLEVVLSLFQVADLYSRQGLHSKVGHSDQCAAAVLD